jgi:hypothetical protein
MTDLPHPLTVIATLGASITGSIAVMVACYCVECSIQQEDPNVSITRPTNGPAYPLLPADWIQHDNYPASHGNPLHPDVDVEVS